MEERHRYIVCDKHRPYAGIFALIGFFAIAIALVTGLATFPPSASAAGPRDISDDAATSITTSQDTTDLYSDFQVNVAFSEDDASGHQKPGLDIQSGDTIHITWSAPAGVTFTGYSRTIELYPDGDTTQPALATAHVEGNDCTITFHDSVNGMQHVAGFVNFGIQTSGSFATDDHQGSVTSGNHTTAIGIREQAGPGEPVFFDKAATYETDGTSRIQWSLWLNRDYRTNLTGNITVTGTLPPTETFSSFDGYSLQNADGTWQTPPEASTMSEFIAHGGTFTVNGQQITITVPASELNQPVTGLVTFTTTSSATAGQTVNNSATIDWDESGETTTHHTDTRTGSVVVPSFSGGITGAPKGVIQVHKVVNGTTDPIPDVHFRVYQVNGETDHTRVSGWHGGDDYVEIVSDDSGFASATQLNDGYYEVQEISDGLPGWISGSSLPNSVFVHVSGAAAVSTTIGNDVKTADVTATKDWVAAGEADTSDHPTVYFKLYRSVDSGDPAAVEDADVKAVDTDAGASSAQVTWANLPSFDNAGHAYAYSVREVDADGNDWTPEGYTKEESGLTVTNTKMPMTPGAPGNPRVPEAVSADEVASGESADDDAEGAIPATGDGFDVRAGAVLLLMAVGTGVFLTRRFA